VLAPVTRLERGDGPGAPERACKGRVKRAWWCDWGEGAGVAECGGREGARRGVAECGDREGARRGVAECGGRERASRARRGGAGPGNANAPRRRGPAGRVVVNQAFAVSDSSRKARVLLGSTGMPGAIVVVKVIFLR